MVVRLQTFNTFDMTTSGCCLRRMASTTSLSNTQRLTDGQRLLKPQYRDVRERRFTTVAIRSPGGTERPYVSAHGPTGSLNHILSVWRQGTTRQSLEREFGRAPFEPYGGVTRQMFAILRAVNRMRKTAGLPLVPRECIRVGRQVVRPFDDSPISAY